MVPSAAELVEAAANVVGDDDVEAMRRLSSVCSREAGVWTANGWRGNKRGR